ncbi:MAG: HRDC domain-containing protein [Planctomycetota bacterium]|nr:HRDC domain-containing protein [Planctomycetota bacterium]
MRMYSVPDTTEIITEASRLTQVIDELMTAPRVSLDIESDGFYNYAERVCIVTLSSEGRDYVVDTLAVGKASVELGRITSRPGTPLLMHSGQNDVLALKRDYSLNFGSVQDTSVAAMLLDLPHTGLAALVEAYLGMQLEKELQRHDWSRRPIERHHVQYLVNDTRHLFRLHDLMHEELRKLDLLDEYEIECRAVAASEPRGREFDPDRFRRIKGHGELSEQQRGVLKALYAWRNGLARELDRAPFRIISDQTLLDIARQLPHTPEQLAAMRGVGEWLVNEQAAAMLEAVSGGMASPANMRPPRRNEPPAPRMDPRQRDTLGKLKRWREREKEARRVGLQAILPTAVLKDLVLAPPHSIEELAENPRIGQARAKRYGPELLKLLNGRKER